MNELIQIVFNGPLCIHEAIDGHGLKLFAIAQAVIIGAACFSNMRRSQSLLSTMFLLFVSWSLSTLAMQLTAYIIA